MTSAALDSRDHAALCDALERRVAECSAQLADAQQQLGQLRRKVDGLAMVDAPSAERCLELLSSRGQIGFLRWTRDVAQPHASDDALMLLGLPNQKSLTVRDFVRLVDVDDRRRVCAQWRDTVALRLPRFEAQVHAAASQRHIRFVGSASYDEAGKVQELLLVLEDVSAQATAMAALSESRKRLSEAQDIANIVYWEWDYSARRAKFSPGALKMLRRPDNWTPRARDLVELAPEDQRDWVDSLFRNAVSHQHASLRYEVRFHDEDGSSTYLHTVAKIEYGANGRPRRLIATVQDVSELKSYRRQVQSLSFFDPLTNLPNRALFVDRLREACARSSWETGQLGLLMLDIDRFKDINDSLGHAAGDSLLKQAAERLRHVLRGDDSVSRLGGDEFAIVLAEIKNPGDMEVVAKKVFSAFAAPFALDGKDVFVSASIGGALYLTHANDVDRLMQFADAALYHAKEEGRNQFQLYESEMTDKAAVRLGMEGDLRRALDRDELMLYYQPKLELATGRMVGAEALMRWNHPTRGMVAPHEFIPLAEDTGLIVPMGEWALMQAAAHAARWNTLSAHPLKVAVNLSARQLGKGQADFAGVVKEALHKSGCRPEWLELEITESLLLEGRDDIQSLLREIADMGITIAIDDFGIGYSALSYLTRFPIRVLKIDRSFVGKLSTENSSAELVKAIVSLGQSLNMELVAEGVESDEQAEYLSRLGCQTVQGFLYGKPMPPEMFETMLMAAPQDRPVVAADVLDER